MFTKRTRRSHLKLLSELNPLTRYSAGLEEEEDVLSLASFRASHNEHLCRKERQQTHFESVNVACNKPHPCFQKQSPVWLDRAVRCRE